MFINLHICDCLLVYTLLPLMKNPGKLSIYIGLNAKRFQIISNRLTFVTVFVQVFVKNLIIMFSCEKCANLYKSKKALQQHVKVQHEQLKFMCDKCGFGFSRITNLKRHKSSVVGDQKCQMTILKNNVKRASAIAAAAAAPSTASSSASAALTQQQPPTPPSTSTAAAASSSASAALTQQQPPPQPSTSTATTRMIDHDEYHYCEVCAKNVKTCHWFYHLRTNSHKRNSGTPSQYGNVRTIRTAFKERIQTLLLENNDEGELRAEVFLESVRNSLIKILAELVHTHTAIKWNIELFGEYIKMMDDDISSIDIKCHQTRMQPSLLSSNINETFDEMISCILAKMSEFQERDSGWTLVKLLHLEVNVNQYQPITGSSYIPLPIELVKKKACNNVHNADIYCFKWAIISALCPGVASPHRCSSYKIADIRESKINVNGVLLNFEGVSFPLPLKDITLFESRNTQISVNVFGYDCEKFRVVGPYHISKEEKPTHINLLLLQDEDTAHYVHIKSLSR